MHDTKERLSLLWIFALLNYLYADVVALFAIVGSPNLADAPHLPPWALLGSAVLMEIPIAMIVACRLLPFRANRLANIIAGAILTLVNGFLTFVPPLVGARTPALPEYLFFATIETVCTSVIIWQAWTWSEVKPQLVRSGSSANRKLGSLLLNCRIAQKSCVSRRCARDKIRSNEGQCEKRAPDTDRLGGRGANQSGPNLFPIYGSAAFQLAFGAEERDRADVSELLYSGRGLSTYRRKETIGASLDDCSSSLVEHLPRRGDGYSNRRSLDSQRPQELC